MKQRSKTKKTGEMGRLCLRLLFAVGLLFLAVMGLLSFFSAADHTVFVDGTRAASGNGATRETAYRTLQEGFNAVSSTGGTVVLCGKTEIVSTTTLALTGHEIRLTSRYNGTDYRTANGAELRLGGNLQFGSPVHLDGLSIVNVTSGNVYLVAMGHSFAVGADVGCQANGGGYYPSVVGGIYNGTYEGKTDVSIGSGYFRNVYGGNYLGSFTGESHVNFVGGTVSVCVAGGNFGGDFHGDAFVEVAGDACYPAVSGNGIVGGSVTTGQFTGNVSLSIRGNAKIIGEVCGGCRFAGSNMKGEVFIRIGENAYIDRNVYAGGNEGNLEGDTHIDMTGGYVGCNLGGGSRSGVVTGDTYLTVTGGRIGYLYGGFDVFGGSGITGSVRGCSHILFDGGDLSGDIYGSSASGTVDATDVTVCSGHVGGVISADGVSASACVKGRRDVAVNIPKGKTLSLGKSSTVGTLSGEGTLCLASDASLTVSRELAGGLSLSISGTHTATVPIVLQNVKGETGSVSLLPVHGETLIRREEGGISYEIRCTGCGTDLPDNVVYVNGSAATGGTGRSAASPYRTLSEGLSALSATGGVCVVCGETDVAGAMTAPAHSRPITVTSVYGEEDYRSVSSLSFGGTFTAGGAMTIARLNLVKHTAGKTNIVAAGNSLTIGEGVVCTPSHDTNWYSLIGGRISGTSAGGSSLTVKSGVFRNLYAGNYDGTFVGDSHLTFIGGTVNNLISGGSFSGNFYGNSYVNMGGEARFTDDTTGGICGTNVGGSGSSSVFAGDAFLCFYGNAVSKASVFGAGRYGIVTTVGNIHIDVTDNAYLDRNIYAAGYEAKLTGDTCIRVSGGEVLCNVAGGSRNAVMDGNSTIELTGGRVCGYASPGDACNSTGVMNVMGAGYLSGASITGKSTILLDGAFVRGGIYGGGIYGSATAGESEIRLLSGAVALSVSSDGKAAPVSGKKRLSVDLSAGGALSVGGSLVCDDFRGGGSLSMIAGGVLTVTGDVAGCTDLSIHGATDAPGVIAQCLGSAAPDAFGGDGIRYDGGVWVYERETPYYRSVTLRLTYPVGAGIRLRHGTDASLPVLTPDESGNGCATFTGLCPGVYNVAVLYTNSDWVRKYLYLDGNEEDVTLFVDLPEMPDGYGDAMFVSWFDGILQRCFDNSALIGFPADGFRTPTLSAGTYVGTRQYATNEDVRSYIEAHERACPYLHVFTIGTTPLGYPWQVVLFTRDPIPRGASVETAAKILRGGGGDREIFMFTAGVHGNEQSSPEAHLALIDELCGEYGERLLSDRRMGGIVMIPRVSMDNSATFTRQNLQNGVNPNRDFFSLVNDEIRWTVKIYDLFNPTVYVDSHEDTNRLDVDENGLVDYLYDIHAALPANLNTTYYDAGAIAGGDTASLTDLAQLRMLKDLVSYIGDTGLYASYYDSQAIPAMATAYASLRGSYSFIVEAAGIQYNKEMLARRTFAHVTALKGVLELVMADGGVASDVRSIRLKTAQSGRTFDEDHLIVLSSAISGKAETTVLGSLPRVYANGTPAGTKTVRYSLVDSVNKARPRATAYVFDAGADFASDVLSLLRAHGISYETLAAGTTLRLRQYKGNGSAATLADASDVVFPNGAVIVFTDTDLGNIVSVLFEPDMISGSTDSKTTLVQMGLIRPTEGALPYYRSEESGIARRLGFRPAAGDVNADGEATNSDIAALIRFLSGWEGSGISAFAADVNGDGVIGNRDAICLIRILSGWENVR